MPRTLLFAVALCAPLVADALAASSATAQIPFRVTEIRGGGDTRGEDNPEDLLRGINVLDCGDTAAELDIATTTTLSVTQLDLWATTDTTMCNTTAARMADMETCEHLGSIDFDRTEREFTLPLSRLTADLAQICGEGSAAQGGTVQLYMLATSGSPERGEVTTEQYGSVAILFDSKPPIAPAIDVDDQMLSGDSQVTVSWEPVTDESPRYRVFDGGPCGEGASPDLTDPIVLETDANIRSVAIDPASDLGLAVGESGSVFIAAIDRANNVGAVSDPVCITRVAVAGFCDVYAEMGETCPDGCAVSAPGAGSQAGWIALALLGLLMRSRQTRRAKGRR